VIVLNGKPTEGNAFGSKVEFAMELVSVLLSDHMIKLTILGTHNVPNCLRGYQWTKHEDDCPLSCRKRCKDQRAYNIFPNSILE
jgi:hypothetical protein